MYNIVHPHKTHLKICYDYLSNKFCNFSKASPLDCYFTSLQLVLVPCGRLPVLHQILHHSAYYIYIIFFFSDHRDHTSFIENRMRLKTGSGAKGVHAPSKTSLLFMKRLNKTETLIFILLGFYSKSLGMTESQ